MTAPGTSLAKMSPSKLETWCRHLGLNAEADGLRAAMADVYVASGGSFEGTVEMLWGSGDEGDRGDTTSDAVSSYSITVAALRSAAEHAVAACNAELARRHSPLRGRPPGAGVLLTRRVLLDTFWRWADDNNRLPTQKELRVALAQEVPVDNELDGVLSSTLRASLKREGLNWGNKASWPRQ